MISFKAVATLLVLCFQITLSLAKRCLIDSKNPSFPFRGLFDPLAFNKLENNGSIFLTEVIVSLHESEDKNCSLGVQFEEQAEEEAFSYDSVVQSSLDRWHIDRRSSHAYLKFLSKTSFANVGVYKILDSSGNDTKFFNLHSEDWEGNDTEVDNYGEARSFMINVTSLVFAKCIQFNKFRKNERKIFIGCASVVGGVLIRKTCNVTDIYGTIDSNFFVNVVITNGTHPHFKLRCLSESILGHRYHHFDIPFDISPVKKDDSDGHIALLVISVAICVVSLLGAFLTRFKCKKDSLVRRHPKLRQVREMPVSLDRQHTVMTMAYDQDDIESDQPGGLKEQLEIWPEWIIKSQLMRFPREDIWFDANKPLGCGNYGYVFNGWVRYGTARFEVAIKQAQTEDCESQDELLKEAEKLSILRDHPNVVNIKGITLETGPDGLCRKYSLVLTLYTSGNLESFLRKNRHVLSSYTDIHRMLMWAYEVSKGMEFLGQQQILHLDLATRNILLTHPHEIAKISDFGLSKHVDELSMDCFENKGIPIRWLPLEVWWTGDFTNASTSTDVWSFGVLMWEIFSLGQRPYHGLFGPANTSYEKNVKKKDALPEFLQSGMRLSSPWSNLSLDPIDPLASITLEVYQLMVECWSLSPYERPSFVQLSNKIQRLIKPECQDQQKLKNEAERVKYSKLRAKTSKEPESLPEEDHEYLDLVANAAEHPLDSILGHS